MKENDFVFDLVKSLDDRELRFIQKLAASQRRPPSRALELLADLRRLATYQPKRLKLTYPQYEVVKFNLKQLILRSLRLMESGETVDQDIALHLENESILYRKGLYQGALRELEQARAIAEKHHRLGRLLEILLLEQTRRIESSSRQLDTEVSHHADLIQQVWEQYGEEIRTMSDYQRMFARYRTHDKPETEREAAPVAEIRPLPVRPASFQSQLYTCLRESLSARREGKLAKAREATQKAIELYDAHPHIRDRRLRWYKILLANYAVYLIPERRFEEVQQVIAAMQEIADPHFNDEAETFQNIAHIRLLIALNSLEFKDLDELIAFLGVGLEKYGSKVNAARLFSLWYNLLLLHIITESYAQADQVLDLIQENKRLQIRKEVQYTTRLLQLIVWYELERWDPPDNAIAAARQYLYRNEELSPFKQTVLTAITRLTSTPVAERKVVYEEMLQALDAIRNDESPQDKLGLEVVTAWAQGKITGKPVSECLRDPRPRRRIPGGGPW